jgi:hypothetical protein
MIASYDELVEAIRVRVDEMNISREELDLQAGIPTGYSGKCLGPAQVKRLSYATMGPVLGAIGCKLLLVEDPEQTAKILRRAQPRDTRQVRSGTYKRGPRPKQLQAKG